MSAKLTSFLLGAALASAVVGLLWWRADVSPERLRSELRENPEFLADNPEILSAARTVLRNRMLASQGSERVELMQGKWQSLVHVAFTPTIGQPDAPLVLLEFTDYTCEPCRASAPVVSEVLSGSPDVRVAILLLPTGGALAEYAARVALAGYRQNPERFAELHHRLLNPDGQFTQHSIPGAVTDLGFDVDQIQREATFNESRRYFDQVRMLAEDMRISGVPAFALNEQLVLGGIKSPQLQTMIQTARAASVTNEPRLTAKTGAENP